MKMLEYSKAYTLAGPFYSGIGHILMFHRISPENEAKKPNLIKGTELTPERLENIIKFYLGHNYGIISLDQLSAILQRQNGSKKYVVFTFDDGYADNLIYAYPIFKKYNAPFTIYVTTGFIDRQAMMWWYSLSDFISNNNRMRFDLDNKTFEFDCSTNPAKEAAFINVRSLIMDCSENECLDRIKKIFNQCKIDLYEKTDELALTWSQVKELSRDPLVTIGAHTVNHYLLNKLSPAAVKREMSESKMRLESMLNRDIKHFSYPFGGKGEIGIREYELAGECGFATATTTKPANIFLDDAKYLMNLPRYGISEDINAQKLKFLTSGLTHCIQNRFKKVVTL